MMLTYITDAITSEKQLKIFTNINKIFSNIIINYHGTLIIYNILHMCNIVIPEQQSRDYNYQTKNVWYLFFFFFFFFFEIYY